MVDAERLVAILGRITARLTILDHYAGADRDELLADRVRLGDLKYTFQTAIEACIDASQHVVADQGLGVPASNAAAFRSLADAGLLDPGLAPALAGAVGFRNVLVHDYAEVDDRRVVANLDRLPEIRRFVAAMTRLLRDPPSASTGQDGS
ncbi:MAG: type VII toxin-antitoxin system HepT family RNase toxin [Acidimicrobiia bacterium]